MEASKLGEHRPASRWTSQMLPACNVSKPKAPASSSCSGGSVSLALRYMTPAGRNLDAEVSGCFCPPSLPSEPGQEHVGGAWIGDLLPETIRSALRPCPVVSSALCALRLAALPRHRRLGARSPRDSRTVYAMPTFPNTFQPRRSNPTAPSSQPLPDRPVRAPGETWKWAVAVVAGNGCRQTALCRAASCLKRDWNSSPSRLGASTREPSQRGRSTQTFPFLGSSHHGTVGRGLRGRKQNASGCCSPPQACIPTLFRTHFSNTHIELPIHAFGLASRVRRRPKLRLDSDVRCPVKSVL